ncbi:MAG: histidine--tRNA ligase [Brevinematales bacterium]|nr:histidine--tRNA ligase [Brevinematales bacterium]
MEYSKLKGTYDILPVESDFYRWIFNTIYEEAIKFGFKEINFPIIEYAKLFQRGVGESSDLVVKKEMYIFEDRGKRLIALRPEGTASSVRLYLENNLNMQGYSAKMFYFGPMFRAENPQTGRYRQFYQFGFEYIGDPTPYSEFELIKINDNIFKKLGIKNYKLFINSIGCKECRNNYLENLKKYFSDKIEKMCEDCKVRYEKNILRILDCKEEICQKYIDNAPGNIDFLCEDCKKHIEKLICLLKKDKIDYQIDKKLVRGLDYYNKTVFEFKSNLLGAQSTFSAGGRYDYLVREFGGPDTPASGFAIGMERLGLLIEASSGKKKQDFYNPPLVYVAYIGEDNIDEVIKIIDYLRQNGISVTTEYKYNNLKKHLKAADSQKAKYAILVGEDEVKSGKYTLRKLDSGEQQSLSLEEILKLFKSIISL